MHAEGLPERIHRATGDAHFASIDPSSPADVDSACSALLMRLDETGDFELAGLIADLAGPHLAVAAEALARDLGLGFESDDLVVAALGDMLAEVPLRPRRIKQFLAFATDRLHEAATAAVDELANRPAPGSSGGSSNHPGLPDQAQNPITTIAAHEEQGVFQMCFHRLSAEDRQILRLVATEGNTLAEAARILGILEEEAAHTFDAARLHLLQSLENADHEARGIANLRKQLGDAIYDYGRQCILAHETTRTRTAYGVQEVASISELSRSIRRLAARASVPAAEVALVEPAASSTAPLRRTIEVLEHLEGRTDSSTSLTSFEAIASDDLQTALKVSDALARKGSTQLWRRSGASTAVMALMSKDRYAEAESAIHHYAATVGEDEAQLYNLACVHAAQGHIRQFQQSAIAMRACSRKVGNSKFWCETIEAQVQDISRATALSVSQIRALFGTEPPGGVEYHGE